MIVLVYFQHRIPYPWGWRVYLADGSCWHGGGVANLFSTPREACRKAQQFIRENPDEFGKA